MQRFVNGTVRSRLGEGSAPVLRQDLALALDEPDPAAAAVLLQKLRPQRPIIKIGHVLMSRMGVERLETMLQGETLFLDLKFHDIPATVARAIRGYAASLSSLSLFTLHGSGGAAMLRAAAEAAAETGRDLRPLIVTGLSSARHDLDSLKRVAEAGLQAGIGGMVCPPPAVAALREAFGPALYLVVPGIRAGAPADDHAATATPAEARAAGADLLVVGRPILEALDPVQALAEYLR